MSSAARTADADYEIDEVLEFRSERLQALSAWWRAKSERLGRLLSRADVNPREIKDALPVVALIDVVAGPALKLRTRLIGTAIARFAGGGGPGGEVWDASHPNPIAARFVDCAQEVVRRRAPIRMRSRHAAAPEMRFAKGENFFAPLSTDGDRIDVILLGAELLVEDGAGGVRSLLNAAL